jgi:hypothetical protein
MDDMPELATTVADMGNFYQGRRFQIEEQLEALSRQADELARYGKAFVDSPDGIESDPVDHAGDKQVADALKALCRGRRY